MTTFRKIYKGSILRVFMTEETNQEKKFARNGSDIVDARIFFRIKTDEGRFSGEMTYSKALNGMGVRIEEQTGINIKDILSRIFRDVEHYLDSSADRTKQQGTLDLGTYGIIKPLAVIYRNGQTMSYESWVEHGRLRHLPMTTSSRRSSD